MSFADAYRSLKGACDDLSESVTVAGPLFQETFPDLAVKFNDFIANRDKHESSLKEAATILRLPDSTKVRKIAEPRTNAINEPFGQSRVLNSTERIAKLEEYKVAADTKRKEKAATAAASKAQKQEKLAAAAEKKQKLQDHHEPLLAWLKQKRLCEDTCTKITKAALVQAFESNKDVIVKAVKDGGEKISKSLSLQKMIELFLKYKLYDL